MSTLSPRFGSHLRLSFLGRFGPACVFRMSHVRTFFLLLWRDLCWRLSGRYGIAPHRILESGCRENENYTRRLRASVLQTYPRVLGNKN
jgi:hypothetical protein